MRAETAAGLLLAGLRWERRGLGVKAGPLSAEDFCQRPWLQCLWVAWTGRHPC